MNYIKSSEEISLTLKDFFCQTTFCVRSSDNSYKICHIYLHNYYCSNKGITTVEVSVWDSLHGYGRHKLTIEEVTANINMKELLMEISATFANHEFTMNECYVEMSVPKENGGTIEITF